MSKNLAWAGRKPGSYEKWLPASKSLGGGLAQAMFTKVADKFYDLVVRSDVGIIDVSWGLKDEKTQAVTKLTNLMDGQSDFSFNALFTSDAAVRQFVNRKQYDGNFEVTQTVTPLDVHVTATTDRNATLAWTPIDYIYDGGGYQVVATKSGGAPVIATTGSKEDDSITVRNLDASSNYSFVVTPITHPHDRGWVRTWLAGAAVMGPPG